MPTAEKSLRPAVEFENKPEPWGNTTEPAKHDPENFRYLVHAINPYAKMGSLVLRNEISAYNHNRHLWGDQSISMLKHPERLDERVSLSMSLVDQDHTATWGDAGLIVEAPEDNVVITSPTDAGVLNDNLDFLMDQANCSNLLDGDSLLNTSTNHSYNEVVAIPTRSESKLRLKGFFFKRNCDGQPCDTRLAKRMNLHAKRLNLPLVPLNELGPYSEDKIITDRGKTDIQLDGRLYMLQGPGEPFTYFNDRYESYFATPEEATRVLTYALNNGGINQAQFKELSRKYQEINRARHTPTAQFNENGQITGIEYYEGYGLNESCITISEHGYGYRVDILKQNETLRQYNSNKEIKDDYISVLDPKDIESIVDRACGNLSNQRAQSLRDWFSSVKHTATNAQHL